jgi:hypothetical protein
LSSPGTEDHQDFYPQRDAWAALLVWGSALILWGSGFAVSLLSSEPVERWIALTLSIPGGLIGPWFWATTSYRLTSTKLLMQSGCFPKRLPYATIHRVRPKFAGIGISFAFSLNTLEVRTSGSRLNYRIAPEERSAFMAALKERCPQLRMRGEELIAFDES